MKVSFERPFECDDSIRPHLAKVLEGEYDVPLFGKFKILDIGANAGAFAVWASHRWPGSMVYSYEPHPETFKLLVKNTEELQVIRAQKGVGAPGVRILYEGKNNSGEASLYMPHHTGRHVEIIDPLELPSADIIKIDTEGCEVEILVPLIEGGRTFSAVMFEYHRAKDRFILDQLLSKDYTLIGAEIYQNSRGTMKYVRTNLCVF